MIIHLDDIPDEGLDLESQSLAPMLQQALAQLDDVKDADRVALSFHLQRAGDVVIVNGHMSGPIEMSCARCLDPVKTELDRPFRFYLHTPLSDKESANGDVELTSNALDVSFMEGDTIDVDVLIREQVALDLPDKPLCRPDCRGICQGCGAELNREPCSCKPTAVDPRFAVLKGLKIASRSGGSDPV
ncbi:MAG: YceD family protein [Myxococcota bacterium]